MGELAKLETFRYQLAIVETYEEIKLIGDAADAYQNLMKKNNVAQEKQNEIGEFIIEVEQKKGAWLNEFYPHGAIPGTNNRDCKLPKEKLTNMPASPKESSRARLLLNAGDEDIMLAKKQVKNSGKIITGKTVETELRKEAKKRDVEIAVQKNENEVNIVSDFHIDIYNTPKKFQIIYADPAWQYWEGGEKNQSLHYKTMTIADICNLPIKNIADENCILFIWVTFPILQECFRVIEAWGFKYSTGGFVWIKKNKISDSWFFGNGSWTRANTELCLIATKGNITRLDAGISQIIDERITDHSKKPGCVRGKIEQLVGKLSRIELFARESTNGWYHWGNEI